MGTRTLTLTFPMPVNLANARMHWAVKHRRHQEWKTRAIVMERGLRGRHRPMDRVRVSALMYVGGGPMDDDNATARLKWCLDLLKERGLIVDDKRPHLTLTGIPEQRQGTPKRVVLTLEEVA
jgi:hypothetical protein